MMYVNHTELVVNEVLRGKQIIKSYIKFHSTEWSTCYCKSNNIKKSFFLCYVTVNGNFSQTIFECQSDLLSKKYPTIFEEVKNIENIQVNQICYDCLPLYHKPHKELTFKNFLHLSAIEDNPLKISCVPRTLTLSEEFYWVKDDSIYYISNYNSLGIGEFERHIGVDMEGELLISKVIQEDKGVYACFVDGEPITKVVLKVIPKHVTETQEFKDGLMQLTYLFSGILILWIPYSIYLYRKK
uniref:CSON012265 protein n=1 Tax=Culicoides sonorensis TaxID=179676 RepID=A0A336MAI2_CULSO